MSAIYGYVRKQLEIIYGSIRGIGDEPEPKKKKSKDVLIAIKDFEPIGKVGIPFKKGQRFLLKRSSAKTPWLFVKPVGGGKKGFAPSNFLVREREMPDYEFITFDADRDRAEEILEDEQFKSGSFIIRTETNNFNCPTLSLKLSVKVLKDDNFTFVHFLLSRENNKYQIDKGAVAFDTLVELVEHYADRRNRSNISLTFSVKKNMSAMRWDYKKQKIDKEEKSICDGAFGVVYKGTIFGNEVVALKSPNLARMTAEDFLKEAEIARPCKHPNVLETIGICSERNFIITEFMANGSLKKYLETGIEYGTYELTPAQCLSVAIKIASAMEYLSSMNIVHRDLAARNILVGETIDIIKVCDFGLARSIEGTRYYITQKEIFPRRWTAPECFVLYQGDSIVIDQEGVISRTADVWSYGVVLWELYSNGAEPYVNTATGVSIKNEDIYKELTENNVRLEKPTKCPNQIYDKMFECWNIDRKQRPDFTELHEFLMKQSSAALSPANSETDSESAAVEDQESAGSSGQQQSHACNAEATSSKGYNAIEDKDDAKIIDEEPTAPEEEETSPIDSPVENNTQEQRLDNVPHNFKDDDPTARPTFLGL